MSELRISMKQIEGVNAIDPSIFGEHKAKYFFKALDLLLDCVYAFLIFRHGDFSFTHLFIFFFGLFCSISCVIKAWELYTEYKELCKFETTISVTYFLNFQLTTS